MKFTMVEVKNINVLFINYTGDRILNVSHPQNIQYREGRRRRIY